MAQVDIYANPSISVATGIPYVVVIQSDLLDALSTRLTVPLAVPEGASKVPHALCPLIAVKGQRLHALAHFAAPLPAKALQRPVDNVAAQAHVLVSAIDAVLSGFQFRPVAAALPSASHGCRTCGCISSAIH